ncbi:hypothetical protein ABPG74_018156 [Tetrahymena malaccensis]
MKQIYLIFFFENQENQIASAQQSAIKVQGKEAISGTKTNDENMSYYQEYCRLFLANQVLTNQMKELVYEKNELTIRLIKLEKRSEDLSEDELNEEEIEEEKKKRIRRQAKLIDRSYICPYESCKKSYGTEGSLNQHIKLKHPKTI